jgi:hypothetical protein
MNTNQETGKNGAARNLATVCLDRCQKLVALLTKVKENLVAEFKQKFEVQERLLRLAINEAEALAWETDYPHLVFPTLALEKVKVAATWNERQGMIRRGDQIFAFAA